MRRPLLVAFALLAVGALVWFAFDAGWLGEGSSAHRGAAVEEAPEEARTKGLAAVDPNAPDPVSYEGDPVGVVTIAGLGDAEVSGTVTGAGAPLRFARISTALEPPHGDVAVRSAKDGRFALRGLAEGPYHLRVSAEGWRTRTVITPALAKGATHDLGTIALTPRPDRTDGIEVKALDPAGKPVAGARVTATTLPYSLAAAMPPEMHGVTGVLEAHAVTDESGVALLSALEPQKYDVIVRAKGFAFLAVQNVVAALGRVERVTVKLSPGVSISGSVVGPDGAGVAGAYVFGMHQPSFRMYETVQTGAGGSFTLTGLDPGKYWLLAGHDDHGMGNNRAAKAGDTGVKVQLEGAGTLAGRVLRADGKPATTFVVRPFGLGQPFGYVFSRQLRVVDAEGRFEASLPPDNYQVDAKEEGGAYVPGPTAVVKQGETTEVEVRLPVPATVLGVVVNDAGDHVSGAEVYVNKGGFPPSPVRELYVRTDAEGAFRLDGLPPERVGLHVRHPAYGPQVLDVTPSPPESARPVTIKLPAGGRVEGRVLRADGSPVPGETVNLSKGFDFFNAKAALTDGDGRFLFVGVAPDSYQVSLGRFEFGGGPTKEVKVPENGTATVEFRTDAAKPGTVAVAGTVTAGGKPVSGATVYLIDGRGFEAAVTTTTDAQGRYEGSGLEPGDVRVSVSTTDGMSTEKVARGVAADATATLDVTFGDQRVTGRIVAEDGRSPISGAQVLVELAEPAPGTSGWSAIRGSATTDTNGSFAVGGLEPGTYRVRAEHFSRASRILEPFRLAEGESKELADIRLPIGAALRGRVTDEDGRPLENAGVTLRDAHGKDVFLLSLSSSGSDGRYEVQGLELGAYAVRIEVKGYAPFEARVDVGAGGAVLDAVVQRGGSLSVRVEDEAGAPVPGARVQLVDGAGRPVTKTFSIVNLFDADVTRTGADGSTTIPDLAPGSYEVGATKEGMVLSGEKAPASLSAGRAASVRVVLKPGP